VLISVGAHHARRRQKGGATHEPLPLSVWTRSGEGHPITHAQASDLLTEGRLLLAGPNDGAGERHPAALEQSAGLDEVGESFLLNEPADAHDQRGTRHRRLKGELRKVQTVVDAGDMKRVGTIRLT